MLSAFAAVLTHAKSQTDYSLIALKATMNVGGFSAEPATWLLAGVSTRAELGSVTVWNV